MPLISGVVVLVSVLTTRGMLNADDLDGSGTNKPIKAPALLMLN